MTLLSIEKQKYRLVLSEKEFKIRYRVDGALYEMSPPPQNLATPVISRVKIMSGLNISTIPIRDLVKRLR